MSYLKLLVVLLLLLLAGCNLGTAPEATLEQVQPTVQGVQTCDQLVTSALSKANTICATTGRNQACYGNSLVQAEMQPNATTSFNLVGDITDLFSIRRLTTTPLNVNSQTWGVVILKAQANLPDTLPGQNVTFLLYGDATLDNITPQMKAVVLKTGVASTTCANAPDSALLLQSPEGAQAALTINGASVTLGSTVYMRAEPNTEMEIGTIEGSAVVSAFNTTRIVQPGAKTGMALGGSDGLQVAGPPSEPEPFDTQVVAHAPLGLLERQVQPPPPIAPVATEEVQPVNTAAPVCVPRGDWNFTYVVQSGDTLSRIASSVGLTLTALQQGNCIPDPNQLQIGQILRVPSLPTTSVPAATVAPTVVPPTAVPTPTNPNLRADSTLVQQGECTTIRWDALNVSKVYFEGQPATGSGSQQVCPRVDTTFTLLVVYPDGKQIPYAIRIQVVLPIPTDTPPPRG